MPGDRGAQPVHHALGVEAVGAGEDDGELVAADPIGLVGAPQLAAERRGQHLKGVVAGLVAARVVDPLEVVQVAQDEPEAAALVDLAHHAHARTLAGWAGR